MLTDYADDANARVLVTYAFVGKRTKRRWHILPTV